MKELQTIDDIRNALNTGTIIPQTPIPLDLRGNLDEAAMQRLVQYYIASDATGLAFGCWPMRALVPPISEDAILHMVTVAAEEDSARSFLFVAGIPAMQPDLAARYKAAGCDVAVVIPSESNSLDDLMSTCTAIAEIMPLLGVAFPPTWHGPWPTADFYAKLLALPTLAALLVPGNTGVSMRSAVAAWRNAGTKEDIPLLLGDGDRFLADLLTPAEADSECVTPLFSGLLSARAAFWTERLAAVLNEARRVLLEGEALDPATLTLALQLGDVHDAVFDMANDGAGALAGLYDVLAWSSLVRPDAAGVLQPGQRERIDAIFANYPYFVDDEGDGEDDDDEFEE